MSIPRSSIPPVFTRIISLEDGHPLDPLPYTGFYGVNDPSGLPAGRYIVTHFDGNVDGLSVGAQTALNVETGVSFTRIHARTGYTAWGNVSPTAVAPVFSQAAGAVPDNTELTLTTTTSNASIYYTTDGSDPTSDDTLYSAPIVITDAVTIKAITVCAGFNDSAVVSAAYTIAP